MKYVLLGAMSSAILLYGFALLYGLTGTTDLMGIATLIKSGIHSSNVIVSLQGNLMELVAGVLDPGRFWLQDFGGAVPHVGTGYLRGCADACDGLLLGGFKGGGLCRALIRVFIDGGLGQINLSRTGDRDLDCGHSDDDAG